MRSLLLLGFCAALSLKAAAPDDINASFSDRYPAAWLKAHILPRDQFHPYPTAAEPASWGAVDPKVQASLIKDGEAALKGPWEVLPADMFLQFARDGNRSHYEDIYFARRSRDRELAVAETLDRQGRFLDETVDGLWAICEETSWSIPAHMSRQKAGDGLPDVNEPVIELFAAETGAQLAWTQYLLSPQLDTVSPLVNPRITQEIERRIITPFLTRDDFDWMGAKGQPMNNWSPWITSNVLTCLLLCEHDEARRIQGISKCLLILDRYLAKQPNDGGCDEGPGYWSRAAGSVFDSLELLKAASKGELDAFNTPKVQAMEKYLYKIQIDQNWFVNFADASAKNNGEGIFCYRIGERIYDPVLQRFGAWFAQRRPDAVDHASDSLGRFLPDVLRSSEVLTANAAPALPRDAWLPDLQVMVARAEAGSAKGLFLAAKGGHNAESHNHNDVGSCVVFADGKPVLIDAGVATYTKKTFSPERYDIWTMQSDYHNLPTINGFMEHAGREFAARGVHYSADDRAAVFSLDIAGAYPKEAGIDTWIRSYAYNRPDRLVITDDYVLKEVKAPLQRHFLLAVKPIEVSPGILHVATSGGPTVELRADAAAKVTIDTLDTSDPRLAHVWGNHIYRLTYTEVNGRIQDHLEVIVSVLRSTAAGAP